MDLKEICKLFCQWHDIDLSHNNHSTGSETLYGLGSGLVVLYKADLFEERFKIRKWIKMGSQKLTESYIRISSASPANLVFDETRVRIINGAIPDYLALLDKTEKSDSANMSSLVSLVKEYFGEHYTNSTTSGRIFFPNKAHQESFNITEYYDVLIFLDSIFPGKIQYQLIV